MNIQLPTDPVKAQVWKAYRDGKPTRVPVGLASNPRVVVMNPQWNPEGFTFEQADQDPMVHITIALRFQLYQRTVHGQCTDSPTALPEQWTIGLSCYNVTEAACFGASVRYYSSQVPATEPIFDDAHKHEVFKVDIDHPENNPYIQDRLSFWKKMEQACRDLKFEGRPVRLSPWSMTGTDGPMTGGCNLRGGEFLLDLVEDPDYAQQLMDLLTRAVFKRREYFKAYWGDRISIANSLADDSIALLSESMYREMVLPYHKRLYDHAIAMGASPKERGIHLCGDASRHFPIIQQQMGVTSYDTGYPIDHGRVRRELGPGAEIIGGPEVSLLLAGSPAQVYDRCVQILRSGVMQGGRFILHEANNLPPCVPLENLQAMYAAALDHGQYQT